MRTTLMPESASASARFELVVDLPSPWMEEVMTKLRERPPNSRNWRFVRRLRKDSARGLRGSSWTMRGRSVAFGSYAMPPRIG